MEYSVNDVVLWTFTHTEIKSALQNYKYLCATYCGDIKATNNYEFIEANKILDEIAEIDNPRICSGMFIKAGKLFAKARKNQRDEEKLLSYLGQMFCNHWTSQGATLNPLIQQEIATLEYEGSFWDRHGGTVISLGSAALAVAGSLCGMPPAPAAGCAARGARGLLDDHSAEQNANNKWFNEFRKAILSLRF